MTTIFSRTFSFYGTANGTDQTPDFIYNGSSAAPSGHIGAEPWETVSINIVGIGVIYFQVPIGLQYSLAGNSYSPDLMLTMGVGKISKTLMFPYGLSFPFPASGGSPPHVDLHTAATSGIYQGLYTVYYTKN